MYLIYAILSALLVGLTAFLNVDLENYRSNVAIYGDPTPPVEIQEDTNVPENPPSDVEIRQKVITGDLFTGEVSVFEDVG